MASCNREKSNVRFDAHVNYINGKFPSYATRTSTKLLGTQTSSLNGTRLRQSHQYMPRLHRQATEIPLATPLGSALQHFSQTCLVDEYSMSEKTSALEEFKTIVDKVTPSLSRNMLGLQFLPAVHALGFSHWQAQSERRVVCYLPVRLPKTELNHETIDKVFIQLPHRFPASMNIEPSSVESDHPGCKFLSSRKLYMLVLKMLRRVLVMKSVSSDRLNFSSSRQLLEITLQENEGWIGEIVICVAAGSCNSGVLYCCKPFHPDTIPCEAMGKDFKEIEELPSHFEGDSISNVDDVRSRLSASFNSVLPEGDDHTERNNSSHGDISVDTNMEMDRASEHSVPLPIITESTIAIEYLTDVSWYHCNPHSENSVVRTVSKTDGGVRMTAMMIVCKLAQHDWRLMPLRCYHVQTAMYHDAEHHLDHSPRWQRNSLQHCVHSLLSILHKFTKRTGGLPHFGVSGIDLWSNWTIKELALAKSALGRLVSSDTALVSLVCRTGNINFERL